MARERMRTSGNDSNVGTNEFKKTKISTIIQNQYYLKKNLYLYFLQPYTWHLGLENLRENAIGC